MYSKLILLAFIALIAIVFSMLLSAYCFFCPALNKPLYDRLIFGELNQGFDYERGAIVQNIEAQNLCFSSEDGIELKGRLYEKPGAEMLILYSHGNGLNITWVDKKIDWMLKSGASVFVYDYRGFGESEGEASLSGVIDDAMAAYQYVVTNTQYGPDKVILYGESLGSGITSALAQRVKSAGVVLDSAYISLEQAGKDKYAFLWAYPSFLMPKPNLNCLSLVEDYHKPVLLIAARYDRQIPSQHSKYLYEKLKGPKALVLCDNSFHGNFEKDLAVYVPALEKFLRTCSSQRASLRIRPVS